jgi:ribosomal protein S18 acetylase RimI-like enzyme
MELALNNGMKIHFRSYQDSDFIHIQALNRNEGWTNLADNDEGTKGAWEHSNVKMVVCVENEVVGYVRGLTDQHVTLYICELAIKEAFRGMGIGRALLRYVHGFYPDTRMELLASSRSRSYYEHLGFRAFYGYRKTFAEY